MKKVFVSALAFDEGKSGLADYTVSVVREFAKDNQVDLLIYPSDAEIFPLKSENIRFRLVPEWLKPPFLSCVWHLWFLPIVLHAKRYEAILFPAGHRRIVSHFPPQSVITFHDLTPYYVPQRYNRKRMFYFKYVIPHYLLRAPVIMAISENTKNDLIRHFNLPPEKITVNYNGYNPEILKTDITETELRAKFKIERPYLFYNARIEHPVKNHIHLIRAFELLPEEMRAQYDLVFCGPDSSGCEVVYDYIKESPVSENIHFLGEVRPPWLGALYKYALIYVFPSLHEGFGIPLLEAMASGLPVVCSNRSALPEIGGDAVVTFDPEVHADIAVKIISVLNNPELRERMSQRGKQRAKAFSWSNHVERIMALAAENKKRQLGYSSKERTILQP